MPKFTHYLCECMEKNQTCDRCEEKGRTTPATRIVDWPNYHLHLCAKCYRLVDADPEMLEN